MWVWEIPFGELHYAADRQKITVVRSSIEWSNWVIALKWGPVRVQFQNLPDSAYGRNEGPGSSHVASFARHATAVAVEGSVVSLVIGALINSAGLRTLSELHVPEFEVAVIFKSVALIEDIAHILIPLRAKPALSLHRTHRSPVLRVFDRNKLQAMRDVTAVMPASRGCASQGMRKASTK